MLCDSWLGLGSWVATFWVRAALLINHTYVFFLLCLFILVISHFDFERRTLVLIAIVLGICLSFHFLAAPPSYTDNGHTHYVLQRKSAFCMCENNDAAQLRTKCAADQHLCFRHINSTMPPLPKSEIQNL